MKHWYKIALRFPNGEVVVGKPEERMHAMIYKRLLDENHPNLISMHDPDVESGFVDSHGNFYTNEELKPKVGYAPDSFGTGGIFVTEQIMTFKNFFLIQEKTGTTEYGCLMAVFPKEEQSKFIKFAHKHIAKEDICDDGYEDEPHTTVIYGFHGDLTKELKSLLRCWGPLCGTLGKVSRFKGKERDVMKVEVKSPCFKAMHKFLMEHYKGKITTDFPTWNGHITLAYVKPGSCKELDGNKTFEGKEVSFPELTYSTPGMHKKTKFSIQPEYCKC